MKQKCMYNSVATKTKSIALTGIQNRKILHIFDACVWSHICTRTNIKQFLK